MSAAKCQLNEAEKKLLKEKQARGVTVVGIDLASRVIQVSSTIEVVGSKLIARKIAL